MTAEPAAPVTHVFLRRLGLLALVVVLLAMPASSTFVRVVSRPPAASEVLSRIEHPGKASLARDCGYSQPIPASPRSSLWLFCDTPFYVRSKDGHGRDAWTLQRFVAGSTAGVGPAAAGQPPGRLAEIPTPGTGNNASPPASAPAQFLPTPAGLVTLGGQPCVLANDAYAASWISGVTQIPSSPDLLITFNDYCVEPPATFLREGFGLVEYDPASNTLSGEVRVFAGLFLPGASADTFGSPIFSGGYLYLFGTLCTTQASVACTAGRISVARVGAQPLNWSDPLEYQWWSDSVPGGWTSDPVAASSIIQGATPDEISVGHFSAAHRGLVLVEQTDLVGRFTVYESPAPAGTWTKLRSGQVPCGAGQGDIADFCRAINGHPELSTPSRLYLSYFDPAASIHGHVVVQAFPW